MHDPILTCPNEDQELPSRNMARIDIVDAIWIASRMLRQDPALTLEYMLTLDPNLAKERIETADAIVT